MAQQSHVLKFGNWDSEKDVPYTAYFEKARKGKIGDTLVNPNDTQENPDAFSGDVHPVRAPLFRTAAETEAPAPPAAAASKLKQERCSSSEDGEFRRPTDSPVHHDALSWKAVPEHPHQRPGDRAINSGDPPRKANRPTGAPDRSTEQSPLHPHYHGKITSKGGVSSPMWERKGSSEGSHGFAPNTPCRSRLRPIPRGDETPEGAAVPKFGDWDENNPASADGFTLIFNKVREEKQTGSAKVPVMPSESSYSNGHVQDSAPNSRATTCCCSFWPRS